MIGEIVGILTDRERHSRVLRNSNFPSAIGMQDPWGPVCDEAERRGFSVEISGGYVSFSRGRSCGSFAANEGGAEMAREFLSSCDRA